MKVLRIELRPDARRKPIPVRGDFIDVDAARTTADISRVRVAFNDSDQYATLKSIAGSVIRCGFDRIALDWDPSEDGKLLVLIVGDQMVKTMTRELDVRTLVTIERLASVRSMYVDDDRAVPKGAAVYASSVDVDSKASLYIDGELIVLG